MLYKSNSGCITVYHVGSPFGWSELFTFISMPLSVNWSPRLAVFGDMGNVNAQSLGRLQEETQHGNLDAVLHVGKITRQFFSI